VLELTNESGHITARVNTGQVIQ